MATVQYLVKHPSGYELLRWGHPPALPVMQGHGVGKEATLVLSVNIQTGQQSSPGRDWEFNLLARVVIRLQETGSPVVSLSTHRLANVQSGFGEICPKDLQIEPNFLWPDQVWKRTPGKQKGWSEKTDAQSMNLISEKGYSPSCAFWTFPFVCAVRYLSHSSKRDHR